MTRWGFLFLQWLKRDLAGRYRGSLLGMLWPVAQPLAQIAVFTLIFHGFMQVSWPVGGAAGAVATGVAQAQAAQGAAPDGAPNGAWAYALNVFAGLAVFNFFAEVLGRAPTAVLGQPNLVTKVKFPLVLLPAVTVGAALVHVGVGAVLLGAATLLTGTLTPQVAWLPLWLAPVLLYGACLALLLASLGVYVRDVGQMMSALTSLLMFLTPIFYPLSAVPPSLRGLFELNPVAWAADSLRGLLLEGRALELAPWAVHLGVSAAAALAAAWVFRRLQGGFADVL
jgi:lipopolysaccharide transport system permease protein